MKLYAISDLHIGFGENRKALDQIPEHPDDWLILAGDIGETVQHLEYAFRRLSKSFARLIWVPGNHELWSLPQEDGLRGEVRYRRLVELCQNHGVLTPEDPYVVWTGEGGKHLLAPLFLLYDYSFCPPYISTPHEAVQWASDSGVMCADEHLLHPYPYPSREVWCRRRCRITETRLESAVREHDCPLVLINHYPLRQDLIFLPLIPRFSIWCGTRETENWHLRFRTAIAVSGHLHIRRTDRIEGVRFEEVSLGYPRQWRTGRGVAGYFRQILPEPRSRHLWPTIEQRVTYSFESPPSSFRY